MTTPEEAMTIQCPACNALPGKPCTAPTDKSRRDVTWVHMAREAALESLEPQDFYLTFGIQYYSETHPRWAAANPKGWVRITAGTYEQARAVAVSRFGLDWSSLVPRANFNPEKFPAGELMALP